MQSVTFSLLCRDLENLEWLFLNVNQLTSLDGQLPENGMAQLQLVLIANNRLERLPDELRKCPRLETMYATNNSLTNLHGVFSRSRKLQLLDLTHNKINSVSSAARATRAARAGPGSKTRNSLSQIHCFVLNG